MKPYSYERVETGDIMKNVIYKLRARLFEGRVANAIISGLMSLIPVLMIGSFAHMLRFFPIPVWQEFIQTFAGGAIDAFLAKANEATFGLLSIHITIFVSYHYSILVENVYNEERRFGGICTALGVFYILSGDFSDPNCLGAGGMCIALFSAIVAVKLFHKLLNRLKNIKFIIVNADYRLSSIVQIIAPVFIVLTIVIIADMAVLYITGCESVFEVFRMMFNKIFDYIHNDFLTGLIFIILSSLLWFFGIHGNNVLVGVVDGQFTPAMTANAEAAANGLEANEIVVKPFFDTFVFMGGCGTALCLLISILLFAKKRNTKKIARMSALPMLFNISEIAVFGLPVIYNVSFLIPFLSVPAISYITAYVATATGLVPVITNHVEWTVPVIFGGYMTTGSAAGAVLQVFNLAVGVLIYRPFILRYEKKMDELYIHDYQKLIDILREHEKNNTEIVCYKLTGSVGKIARMLCNDIRNSIESGDGLNLKIQPQYHYNGTCIGGEVLLRYIHPELGMIYPPLVLALAKERGFLEDLEKWICKKALVESEHVWESTGKRMKVSINVTGDSVQDSEFINFLIDAKNEMKECHMDICIEVTEQTALTFDNALKENLLRLKEAGYLLAIDDFTMGNTSFEYLQIGVFDLIKLDGAIVHSILENENNCEIVSSICKLSNSLGLIPIAEYVDDEKIKERLASLGCDIYQGWLFSKDVKFEEFIKIA